MKPTSAVTARRSELSAALAELHRVELARSPLGVERPKSRATATRAPLRRTPAATVRAITTRRISLPPAAQQGLQAAAAELAKTYPGTFTAVSVEFQARGQAMTATVPITGKRLGRISTAVKPV